MEAFYLYQQQQQQAASSFFVDPFLHYLTNSPINDQIPHHQNGSEFMNNNHSINNNDSSSFTSSYQHSSNAIQEETPTSSDLDVVLPLSTPPLPPPQSQSPSLEKKRKKSGGSCLTTCGNARGVKGSKSRRKKPNGVIDGEVEEKSKLANDKELKDTRATIDNEEPPSGYIHVRARRGQATDSHSLAERVRRERISERMKKLQGLVPGCDKVIGKALVLDEIINYVQSLQNQVEFLSMKLASVHPILYGLGAGFEDYMNQTPEEMGSISLEAMPSAIQNSHSTPPTAFEGATNNSIQQMIEPPPPPPPPPFSLHAHGPTSSFSQGSGSFLMQVGDQIRGLILNQAHEINNMGSFQ